MGTVSQFFQPPLYWQQFEELSQGILREAYDIPTAQIYGRPGQAQFGVDVAGTSKRYGSVGVQCKRMSQVDNLGNPLPGGKVTRRFLRDAAKEALTFPNELDLWVLATTARRDTQVQNLVHELNEEREKAGIRTIVVVWSWDDCVSFLNSFPALQKWYYEQVIQVHGAKDLDLMILETIAMAFHRPAFEVPLNCEAPDAFSQALQDTQRALRTGELVDRISRQVIRRSLGGWRDIDDDDWRAALKMVDDDLRDLRQKFEKGLKDEAIVRRGDYLDFTDHHLGRELEHLREDSRHKLDEVLREAGIPGIL